MGRVQVEVALQFNNTASPDDIPTSTVVVDTLIRAVNASNSTLNLPIDLDSILVIGK